MVERADRTAVATFFAAGPIQAGSTVTLGEGEAQHARVRRIGLGAPVRLVDGGGVSGWGSIIKLAKGYATVDVQQIDLHDPPPPVHLMVPIADRDRALWLAEKVAEFGVASWRPVLWRRSRSVSPRGEGVGFQQKVRARMTAALTQSGGTWLPTLYPDATLERAIAAVPAGTRFLLDAGGVPILRRLMDAGGGAARLDAAPVTLALGPEGGLEPAERDVLLQADFTPVNLGPLTLRFETAGVAAVALVRAVLTALPEELSA